MSEVFFIPSDGSGQEGLAKRLPELLEKAGIGGVVGPGDFVALKVHFGEPGNPNYLKPFMVKPAVDAVKALEGKPFLTDAGTLYVGRRGDAVEHLGVVGEHGFGLEETGAPALIADGLIGKDSVDVPYGGKHFKSLKIASAAIHCDAMMVLTHFKGHMLSGFGGAFKNVGMGLAARAGKQQQHGDVRPEVDEKKCVGCLRCLRYCPADAIVAYDKDTNETLEVRPASGGGGEGLVELGVDGGHAKRETVRSHIDGDKCIGCGECVTSCRYGAIAINWKTEANVFQEKMAEYTHGIVSRLDGKMLWVSYVVDVTSLCDCLNEEHAPVVDDIGVLASMDPVAIDQASFDMVTEAPGIRGTDLKSAFLPGEDKFKDLHDVDSTHILKYAEELGMGSREYTLRQL